jgi:hypothetical protein
MLRSRIRPIGGPERELSRLPSEPVPSRVFVEEALPALFAELELGPDERALDLEIGIVLTPDDTGEDGDAEADRGGAWTLHLVGGELGIAEGRGTGCVVTVVQSVSDWRAALWEGRPRLVADLVDALAESGPNALRAIGEANRPKNPAALEELRELGGMVEMVVSGEAESGDDWRVALLIGPGPVPETAQATVRLGAEQAEAIRRGVLHPLEALMSGSLRLEGDLGLILRLQAIALAASLPPPAQP